MGPLSDQLTQKSMNAWYFSFEFPPEFGGGLSSYMGVVAEAYGRRNDGFLVVFTLSFDQSGLMTTRYLHDNVLLVSLNPRRSLEANSLGWWVNVSRLFERFADLLMVQVESGALNIPRPNYIEFADGFGIGTLTVQQKLCGNSRFAQIPIVVNAHTPTYIINRMNQVPVYRLPNYWTGKMELQALAGADLVIGPSQAILDVLQDELQETGARFRRAEVLHNPFFVEEYESEEQPADFDHFYMASRLTHWKGPEQAIQAMQVLWSAGVEVPLLVYGEDKYFEPADSMYSAYIEKQYKRWVDRGLIQLMGKVPREEIKARARTAFAQLHPSHFDNFPYSVVEAMSEGQVCIAGVDGGIKEIATDGYNIILADVNDPKSFSSALERAMGLNSEERAKFAENAMQTVRSSCDPDFYLTKKEKIVSELEHTEVDGGPSQANDGGLPESFPFLSPPDEACVFPVAESDEGPALSVVIPYFNMGEFVDETIESVTSCTIQNLEIVLVNDGSNDPASIARLDELHKTHGLDEQRLRIVNIPNGGVANARNTGVREARAPLVTLLDPDDLVASRYYEKAIRILRHYANVSFVGAWIEDYNQEGRIRNWATWNAEPPIQLLMNQTNCQSLVYKREAFLQDGEHDSDLRMFLDDWEGVISLLAGGHRGVMIPEPLFRYRIRGDSIFRTKTGLWSLNNEKIVSKHRHLYNTWGAEIAAFLNANGPNNFYHVAGKQSQLPPMRAERDRLAASVRKLKKTIDTMRASETWRVGTAITRPLAVLTRRR
ncbi:glycosyltransferase involved in cell wall biosynthesis [Halopolyspora algeriensis]|uniref:Glycosyltransferase involved in cell wall biosynthesis n=1 Tax=Halopolyspora algeriensis TaxID=1500506 RepID=A0A368VTA8_9ACTN|nr:glycosyltransferase [Halopolyspora algeriensis]RCW43687.1 glycosyltransferase involved in cell wall biosynthesis [Halopolyspora algeriensis]TQM47531.1 glycosyltransferase involved in cell wall biosynthesis [Halopolyspora algeriensis]